MIQFWYSDRHASNGSRSDDSCIIKTGCPINTDKQWLKWKAGLNADYEIALGDILDRDQTRLENIIREHPLLLEDLNKKNRKYIPGNHDWMNRAFHSTQVSFVTDNGLIVQGDHAHQGDPKMTSWYIDAGTWILGVGELIYPDLDYIDNWPIWSKGKPKSKIEENVEAYVRTFIGKADIKVAGHDHRAKVKVLSSETSEGTKSIMWVGLGHNTNGYCQGVKFDTETGRITPVNDHL